MAEQLVYFIRGTESGRIKIGIAANPARRLAMLQIGSPEILEIIGVTPGGDRLESDLHHRFAHANVHGEWFECSQDLLLYIGELFGWGVPTPQQEAHARKAAELRAMLP